MKVSRSKAVVVLIGANDYGFADTSSSRQADTPERGGRAGAS
jgi:hypothetical protein